jgi:hypothetical protein
VEDVYLSTLIADRLPAAVTANAGIDRHSKEEEMMNAGGSDRFDQLKGTAEPRR